MSTRADENADRATFGADTATCERYAALRLGDSAVIIYDRRDEDAWIQSQSAVKLRLMA